VSKFQAQCAYCMCAYCMCHVHSIGIPVYYAVHFIVCEDAVFIWRCVDGLVCKDSNCTNSFQSQRLANKSFKCTIAKLYTSVVYDSLCRQGRMLRGKYLTAC
jgi:hypothetical protein